jgi:hypothetical protein
VANDEVAVPSCRSAELIAGAFCLTLSELRPLAASCNPENAVLTFPTAGSRAVDAEATAASKLVLTLAMAVFSAVRPSCKGFTFTRASNEDFNADEAAQTVAGADVGDVPGAADGDGFVVPWFEVSLQAIGTTSRTTVISAGRTHRRTELRGMASPPRLLGGVLDLRRTVRVDLVLGDLVGM